MEGWDFTLSSRKQRSGLSTFPFHSESERDWYAWLGLYIGLWSATEASLGRLISFIYKFRDGKAVEAEPPLNLDRRIKFLKRAATKLDALECEKNKILAMMDAIKEDSEFRHMLIHGSKVNLKVSNPHFASLSKLKDRKAPDGERLYIEVDRNEIERHYHQMGTLLMCLLGCQERLIAALEAEVASDPRSDAS